MPLFWIKTQNILLHEVHERSHQNIKRRCDISRKNTWKTRRLCYSCSLILSLCWINCFGCTTVNAAAATFTRHNTNFIQPAKRNTPWGLNTSSSSAVMELRGGGWRFRNRIDTANATTTSIINVTVEETAIIESNQSVSPIVSKASDSWTSSVSSLFHFHNQLKAQASVDEAASASASPVRIHAAQASNRGGAMVAISKPKTTSMWRRAIPTWLAPVESSLVSSYTAQWVAMDEAAATASLEEEDDEEEEDASGDADDDESSTDVFKIQEPIKQTLDKLSRDGTRRNRAAKEPHKKVEARIAQQRSPNKHVPQTKTTKINKELLEKEKAEEDDDELEDDDDEDDDKEEDEADMDDIAVDETVAQSLVPFVSGNVSASLNASSFTPSSSVDSTDDATFVSSGYWDGIDRAFTFGFAETHPALRISRKLRRIRKMSAQITGMHGFLSGKPTAYKNSSVIGDDDPHMGAIRRRIAAISRARENLARFAGVEVHEDIKGKRAAKEKSFEFVIQQSAEEESLERLRRKRVREIDDLIAKSQRLLQDLACEKDVLQRRPNPLWNYTAEEHDIKHSLTMNETEESVDAVEFTLATSRDFSFPPPDLVDEYLDMLFASGRIVKLNHTDLWHNSDSYFDDDEDDDELSSPINNDFARQRTPAPSGGSGSWLLRNGLGEKIGEAAETAGYKAVCQSVMSVLARGLAALHGVNIMKYSDIALSMESVPDLPPLAAGIIPSSGKSANYAQGAIERAMKRGARKRRSSRRNNDFIQRDAVVETLLSHCQISAPLLTLFPIAWQRALLGNIITLVAAVITDFFEGVELQILGHRLSFSFKPISESDMLRNLGSAGRDSWNRRSSASQEQFEAAVQATATELSENLKFLDRWHERALGSGLLRQQIANLIARVVLTLADDVLGSARMDLWTAQAGGPRLIAGLEYRQ
ncbi:hypothetical protein MPSEU_000966400 [Mayamaea pseudoterrestris]|nr:hypothetical protein MPSEU_000966400 [Mayamaea pseudoterrestris]